MRTLFYTLLSKDYYLLRTRK